MAAKDSKTSHSSYADGMRKRAEIHDDLIDQDYRRGYVSMDESPGADNAPLITHRIEYRHVSDRGKRCELVQTFKDVKGSGETILTHEKESKSDRTGAEPSKY